MFNMGKFLPEKGKVRESNVSHALFGRPVPFLANMSLYLQLREYPCNIAHDIFLLIYHGYF